MGKLHEEQITWLAWLKIESFENNLPLFLKISIANAGWLRFIEYNKEVRNFLSFFYVY